MKKSLHILAAIMLTIIIFAFGCKKSDPDDNEAPFTAPEGAINGLFTINENGDQVYFSQGNL